MSGLLESASPPPSRPFPVPGAPRSQLPASLHALSLSLFFFWGGSGPPPGAIARSPPPASRAQKPCGHRNPLQIVLSPPPPPGLGCTRALARGGAGGSGRKALGVKKRPTPRRRAEGGTRKELSVCVGGGSAGAAGSWRAASAAARTYSQSPSESDSEIGSNSSSDSSSEEST